MSEPLRPLDYAKPPRRTSEQLAGRVIVLTGLGMVILGLAGTYFPPILRWLTR